AGIKPLYYGMLNGGFSWGSELKALRHYYGEKSLEVDYTALYDFMSYLYIPCPKSLYKNIFKLEAAHFATYNIAAKSLSKKRYWQLPVNRHIDDVNTAKEKVKSTIETAVHSHLVADVPVGTFLSGGVDSSIVSYEVSQLVDKLTTCSIGFDDARVNESHFAQMVADKIGSNHITENMDHGIVNDHFSLLKNMYDEPFGDTSAFPTYAVSKLAKENMTVVLTGDGADELFGGYGTYKCWYQALTPLLGFLCPLRPLITYIKNADIGMLSRLARKAEIFAIVNPLERKIRLSGGFLKTDKFKKEFRKKYNIPENYNDTWHSQKYYRKDLPLKSRYMYLDFHTTMTDGILCKVDRASMAHSIETRVPFLSKNVIESAWQINEDILFLDGELKGLLKSIYVDVLPKACLYRRKQGFSLGQTKQGDKLHLGGKPLPLRILNELYDEELS
ncbi:MAG: asparagine synthase (glutamine-hydrolyzing), partial [bacterium]